MERTPGESAPASPAGGGALRCTHAAAPAVRPAGGRSPYLPRRPEASPLHRVLADHFATLERVHEEHFEPTHGPLRAAATIAPASVWPPVTFRRCAGHRVRGAPGRNQHRQRDLRAARGLSAAGRHQRADRDRAGPEDRRGEVTVSRAKSGVASRRPCHSAPSVDFRWRPDGERGDPDAARQVLDSPWTRREDGVALRGDGG
jgi:hypothetical protein